MKVINLVAVVLFILVSSFSSWLIYNVSEFTQPFPKQAIPGRFDYLAFVQNWQISGCLTEKPCVITPGENFTIHGLWPALKNGRPVIFCKPKAFDKKEIIALDLELNHELKKLWASLYMDVYQFWKHEWNKHGGCTGLPQDEYFRAGYTLRKKYDFLDYLERKGIRPGDHASVDNITKALEAGISDTVGKKVENIVHTKCINAGGKNVLYEIVLCLDKKNYTNPKECPTRCRRRPLIPARSDLPSPPPLPSIAGTVATDNSSVLQAY